MTSNSECNCKVCGHPKSEHRSHTHPDWTNRKITSKSCSHHVGESTSIDMGTLGVIPINHQCSCDGYKPNTSLMKAIKKYQKFLRNETDKRLVKDMYIRKQVLDAIKRFRKSIKENPENKLHWQLKGMISQ